MNGTMRADCATCQVLRIGSKRGELGRGTDGWDPTEEPVFSGLWWVPGVRSGSASRAGPGSITATLAPAEAQATTRDDDMRVH
jgi:hypothetical protein